MDVEVLLVHFCRSHTLRTWAILGSLDSLRQCCSHLKEVNMQLATLVRVLLAADSSGASSTTTLVSTATPGGFFGTNPSNSSQNLRSRLFPTSSGGFSALNSAFSGSATSSTIDMLDLVMDKQTRSTNTSLYNSKERL